MVFVPSHGVLTELKTHGITNLKIWSRGIHPHLFNPQLRSETLRSAWGSPLKKIIVYSGRFVWYKGLRVFIDVYQLFQQRRPNQAAFVLLGSGPEENVLRKAMPKAIFPGYLHGEALGQAYASADIFFFPSVTETFGNVVQEAVSCGLPAVVSDVGGCQEIVRNSQAGLIAKARDTEDYFNCLTRLIDDPLLYRTLRENGLNYFKHRSWNEINQIVIDQYHHTVAAAQKKG
jgi:glycosyltransferase involved in cell wall biosynthesis